MQKKIMNSVTVDGMIDDFTSEEFFLDKPIISLSDAPSDALVLILSGGRPLTAKRTVERAGLECLDYFSFYKYSGLPLEPIVLLGNFQSEFDKNEELFRDIYERLGDELSKEQFLRLIKFKLTLDVFWLEGFSFLEDKQYFEPFIEYSPGSEIFADVGGYDGYTTEQFIEHFPDYQAVHFFEPEGGMMAEAKEKLHGRKNITFHSCGLSDRSQTLRFNADGSCSKITEGGAICIDVVPMDDIIKDSVTFIKIDVEGGESEVLRGAERIIRTNHPKIAVSVYHKPNDFWKIPQQILSIRSDYTLYLRHYTESIYETVMFFIPKGG